MHFPQLQGPRCRCAPDQSCSPEASDAKPQPSRSRLHRKSPEPSSRSSGLSDRLQFLLPALLLHHRPVRLHRRQRRRISNSLRIAAYHRALRRLCALLGRLDRPLLRRRHFLRALLLVRALQVDPRLQHFLHQVRALALRALLRDRLVIRREIALGIIRATPEDISPSRLALSYISGPAFGTLQSFNQVLLHVLALRIPGTGYELPVCPLPKHQRFAAQRAVLARRLRRILLLLLLLA